VAYLKREVCLFALPESPLYYAYFHPGPLIVQAHIEPRASPPGPRQDREATRKPLAHLARPRCVALWCFPPTCHGSNTCLAFLSATHILSLVARYRMHQYVEYQDNDLWLCLLHCVCVRVSAAPSLKIHYPLCRGSIKLYLH